MGAYDSHFTGRIDITPPLTWAQIKNNTANGLQDLQLVTTETIQDTPTGQIKVITGDAIIPLTTSAYSGYEIHVELQSMLDAFPGHEFTGTIGARPEDLHGDPWRYIIRDRTVIRQKPQTTWVDSDEQQ
jgi:hypothetical protein